MDSVAVMNVPVNYEDAVQTILINGILCGNGYIVEDTETRSFFRESVVARGADKGKKRITCFCKQAVNALNAGPRSKPGRLIAFRTDRGVRCQAGNPLFSCL